MMIGRCERGSPARRGSRDLADRLEPERLAVRLVAARRVRDEHVDVRDDCSTPRLLDLFTRGASWKIGSQGLSQVLRLTTTLVIVRLVSPGDYGLAAMALVLSSFAVVFSDLGFGSAIVQRARLTQVDISTAFWISVGAGAALTSTVAALAGPIADGYAHPAVRALVLGISPIFLIDSLATTQRALLARKIDFRSLELRGLLGTVSGSSAAIATAAGGAGAWALVVQELVAAVVGTVLLWWLSPWRPSFAFSAASGRDLGGYAIRKAGARLLSDVNDTADNVLVGRFLGASALAVYSIAYKTALRPMVNLVTPLQEVLFPVLSRAQDDRRRVGDAWLRVTRLTAAAGLPALCGVAILAPEFVDVVLGRSWGETAEPLRILAVVGAVQVLTGATWSVLGAVNAMTLQLRIAAARTVVNVAAFAVGLHWGLNGVATAYAAASVLLFLPMVQLTARRVELGLSDFGRVLAGTLVATTVMALVVVPARALLLDAGIGPAIRLVLLAALGAVVYGTVVAWRDRALRADVRGVALSVARRRQALANLS